MSEAPATLLVVMSDRSVSFCGYDGDRGDLSCGMTDEIFAQAVSFARDSGMRICIVHDGNRLSEDRERLLDDLTVSRIVPFSLLPVYPDALCVITPDDMDALISIAPHTHETAVIKLSLAQSSLLPLFYLRLFDRFKRLNVFFTDAASCTNEDFAGYGQTLVAIGEGLIDLLPSSPAEIDAITDALLLNSPRTCGAGFTHLTVGPNGLWYPCPAFFYDFLSRSSGARTADTLVNARYFDATAFPLCRSCACTHCPRCAYLHKKCTGEYNTPPRQQCILKHMELAYASIVGEFLRNRRRQEWPLPLKEPVRFDPLGVMTGIVDPLESAAAGCVASMRHTFTHRSFSSQHGDEKHVSRIELQEIVGLSERINGIDEMLSEPDRLPCEPADAKGFEAAMQTERERLFVRRRDWWTDVRRRYAADNGSGPIFIDFESGRLLAHKVHS
jgi:CXXX repeat peptide maturase